MIFWNIIEKEMRKMRKFVKTEKYGTLYVDRILFESYYPVLFSCKNDRNDVLLLYAVRTMHRALNGWWGKQLRLQ